MAELIKIEPSALAALLETDGHSLVPLSPELRLRAAMEIRAACRVARSDDPESTGLRKRLESVATVLQKEVRDALLSSRPLFVESHLTHACLSVVDGKPIIVVCRGLYNLVHFRTALTAICSKLAQNDTYASPIEGMSCADAMMLAGQVVLFDAYAMLRPPATAADILSSEERRDLELGVNTSLLLLVLHEIGHQALGHTVPKQVAEGVSAQQMASREKPRRELEFEADAYSITAIADAWRPRMLASLISLHDVFHFLEIFGIQPSADDYLTKTVSAAYLVARVNALIRRVETLTKSSATDAATAIHEERLTAEGSDLQIDSRLSVAYWRNKPVDLSLTQFWIIADLAQHAGTVRSIQDLMKAANITVQPNTIVAHIKTIREKIQKIDPSFACIKAERARGYRWLEEIDPSAKPATG